MIEIQDIRKSFDDGATYAVDGVSLTVQEAETLVLLGSSGSGKTTTLKMINRLLEPSDGCIRVDGRDNGSIPLVDLRRSIGYVFQGIGLFPHMTIGENVSVVLKLKGVEQGERRTRAAEMLELVDLDASVYHDRYPAELSGGQRQRIGVARALAADPAYLLMDEPFGALDAVTRDTLQEELIKLKSRLRKTVVFVTHDIFEAINLADRIAVMHEGRLEQVGTPAELLDNAETEFVKDLFDKPLAQLKEFRKHIHES